MRLLAVEDDREMAQLIADGMGRRGYQVTSCAAAADALHVLDRDDFDVVLTDVRMTGMNGIELCERIVANRPDVPVVVVTAFGSLDTAVAALRAGAFDFLTKPFTLEVLKLTLDRALAHRALREEVVRLRKSVEASRRFEEIVGASPAMQEIYDLLDRVADTDVTVLVTGESGTGKELVARALHARGQRRGGPFVALSCAAMPDNLLETELFGHVKGAFTDAVTARPGLFVQAHGGTLFLDEIGELPPALQPKLLRALQERRVRQVGGQTEVPFDVRLVCATNRDLETAVEEGRFREDLFYRINVLRAELPPLRARGSDVLLLAQSFVSHYAALHGRQVKGISQAAAAKLSAYSWPGNVRELKNTMERAVALARFSDIMVDDLPERIREYQNRDVLVAAEDPSELVTLEEVEKRYILRVLDAVGGNKALAARTLGLHRKTLYRKLRQYGRGPGSAVDDHDGGDHGDDGEDEAPSDS